METEWKRNGKKHHKSSGNKVYWNGVELEWKWNGKFSTEKDNVQWNGNGMEMEWKQFSEKVYMIVYRKWECSRQKKVRNF